VQVLEPLTAGAVPTASDFAPAKCEAIRAASPFRYDVKIGAARSERDIQRGETVAAIPEFALAAVRPGQRLYIKTRTGPVTVQREVKAFQPAMPSRALFVEAADGTVFSAPPLAAAP
jgi:hypothetical protein